MYVASLGVKLNHGFEVGNSCCNLRVTLASSGKRKLSAPTVTVTDGCYIALNIELSDCYSCILRSIIFSLYLLCFYEVILL